jgi:hypothetical protein
MVYLQGWETDKGQSLSYVIANFVWFSENSSSYLGVF